MNQVHRELRRSAEARAAVTGQKRLVLLLPRKRRARDTRGALRSTLFLVRAGYAQEHVGYHMEPAWKIYEHAARTVINDLRRELGVSSIEGKQDLSGRSGTSWELDARALVAGGEQFVVVEVRRYTTNALKQEDLGAIAFRIQDVGASGGIVVSPLPMQSGAELVARSAGIEHIRLTPDSTSADYLAEYMGRRFIGASIVETATARDFMDAEVVRPSKGGT